MKQAIITIPRLRVNQANAYHGPLVWGFPPVTAWTGLMTAMNLRLMKAGANITLTRVGVVSHEHSTTLYKGYGTKFAGPRAPLNGTKPQSIQESQQGMGYHLLSLLFQADYLGDVAIVEKVLLNVLLQLRFAGGVLFTTRRTKVWSLPLANDAEADSEAFRASRKRWLLGSTLIHRPGLLMDHWNEMRKANASITKHAAWLDLFTIIVKEDQKGSRRQKGWVVPITTGFTGISPLYSPGEIPGTRDPSTPFRFVEPIWDVGEWLSPSQVRSMDDMLWVPSFDQSSNTYRCITGDNHV